MVPIHDDVRKNKDISTGYHEQELCEEEYLLAPAATTAIYLNNKNHVGSQFEVI